VISVRGVSKFYGDTMAVDDISFEVATGEVVGFLGPNGAGKTTTMRMLTGSVFATSGSISIAGFDTRTQPLEARRSVGFLPEASPLYSEMTTMQFLRFVGRLRGIPGRSIQSRVDYVMGLCGLQGREDTQLGKLSKGYKQRVGLAQAIIHDPMVLILDEPTSGVDPIQISQTRQLIRELGKDRTVLFSTHILPEIEAICNRVIILNDGKIVLEHRIEDPSKTFRTVRTLKILAKGSIPAIEKALKGIGKESSVDYHDPYFFVRFPFHEDVQPDVQKTLSDVGCSISSIEEVQSKLEDIFLTITKPTEVKS